MVWSMRLSLHAAGMGCVCVCVHWLGCVRERLNRYRSFSPVRQEETAQHGNLTIPSPVSQREQLAPGFCFVVVFFS